MTADRWTDGRDDALAEAWNRGDTLATIAADLKCPAWEAWARVQKLRAAGRSMSARKPRWTSERRNALARARREGYSLRELEAQFEITRGTLTSQLRTLRRMGYDVGDWRHR